VKNSLLIYTHIMELSGLWHIRERAGIAYATQLLATSWMIRRSDPCCGNICRAV